MVCDPLVPVEDLSPFEIEPPRLLLSFTTADVLF